MCIFKALTGLPCPGCGMTRSFLHLFEGHLEEAFFYHPLFWVVPIVFGILLFRKHPIVAKFYRSQSFWTSLLVLLIGVYVYRMVGFFPNQTPMDFDFNAVLPRLFLANR